MRRVALQDYHALREHYVNFGEMESRFLYDFSAQWTLFLNYFSEINEKRIENEIKFEEDEGIGEEKERKDVVEGADGKKKDLGSVFNDQVSGYREGEKKAADEKKQDMITMEVAKPKESIPEEKKEEAKK